MATGDKIPEEYRGKVTDVFLYVKARLPSPPKRHMEYLFEAYNEYVEPHNCKDIGCRTDRARVLNIISTYVRIWKEREANSQ